MWSGAPGSLCAFIDTSTFRFRRHFSLTWSGTDTGFGPVPCAALRWQCCVTSAVTVGRAVLYCYTKDSVQCSRSIVPCSSVTSRAASWASRKRRLDRGCLFLFLGCPPCDGRSAEAPRPGRALGALDPVHLLLVAPGALAHRDVWLEHRLVIATAHPPSPPRATRSPPRPSPGHGTRHPVRGFPGGS